MTNRFKYYTVREYSCKLLEAIDNGLLDPTVIVQMCVQYMSEDEVKDMLWMNELHEFVKEAA